MTITPINEVRVGVLMADGGARDVPVSESPYYLTLERNDPKYFEDYRNVLMKVSGTPDQEMDYRTFRKLCVQIHKCRFVIQEPRIRFNDALVCLDGHHRLAILLWLYGERLGLEIVNLEVQSTWARSSK